MPFNALDIRSHYAITTSLSAHSDIPVHLLPSLDILLLSRYLVALLLPILDLIQDVELLGTS